VLLAPVVVIVVAALVAGPREAGEAGSSATDAANDLLFSPTSPVDLNR
jgi:hypothetical protein